MPKKNIFATTTGSRPLNPKTKAIALKNEQQALCAALTVEPSTLTAPPPPSPEELARQQEALAALAAQQQEQLRRQQLLEQMGQYRYLGYVKSDGVQRRFWERAGKSISSGRVRPFSRFWMIGMPQKKARCAI
jgi:hypothetical protein